MQAHWCRGAAASMALAAVLLTALMGGAARAEGPNAVRTNPAFFANTLPANDDGSTGQVPIGFELDFLGNSYDKLYVNNNGNVTFDGPMPTYTPFGLTPAGTTKIIAAFFADVDTRDPGSGLTRYGHGVGEVDGHTAFAASYVNVGYYNQRTDKLNSFQLVLIQREDTGSPGNFDIELNYDKIQWESGSASGGTNGLGGTSAGAGYASGTGEAYELSGSRVNGAFLDSNTTTGLIHNSLNSPQLGRYVLSVRNGVVLPPGNQAPVAEAGGPYSGDEGSAIELDGTASSDADGDPLTYSWTITPDGGNDPGSDCEVADPSAAQTDITCNDDGTFTATLTVSDGSASHTDSSTVTVDNVDPVIEARTLSGNTGTACLSGNGVDLAFTVSDASSLDEGDLTGSVDWGDGTSDTFSGSSFSGTHSYAPGTYTIEIAADDQDGGTDSSSEPVQRLYSASGFLPPINSNGTSVFKLGSTVPVKIVVRDCAGDRVSTLSPQVGLTRIDTTPDHQVNEVVSSSAADSGTTMRWSTDQYIYNLSTKRSQFCQTGTAFCTNGDLTAGTYRVRVTDAATNDAFAPVAGQFHIRQ
jgi:hypothetical protein